MQPKIQKEKHKNSFIKQFPAFKGNISSRNKKTDKELLYGRENLSSLPLSPSLSEVGCREHCPGSFLESGMGSGKAPL